MTHTRRSFFQSLAAAGMLSGWAVNAAETPKRDMIVRSVRPEDYEMPLDGFTSWITPIDRFYVRSHHYTPRVALADWKLSIGGEVQRPVTLTMADLKALPKVELVSVMECAGNGRALYNPPVPGAQWVYGAVGNGRWTGVRLADVLAKVGLKESAKNLLFDGADVPMGTMPEFKRSVPLQKAMHRDTMLAYEMNGEALPISHGFPLRLVVPGWGGDSWVKWVTNIDAIDHDFDGFFMKTAYRHPGKPVTPGTAVDPAQMHPVESIRIKSVIAGPADDSRLAPGPVKIHGAAWSGESPVSTVEVSVDRGRTWKQARLNREQARYGWRLWEFDWTPAQPAYYVIMARATNAAGDTQPVVEEWNPSGYLNNVIQQVNVEISSEPKRTEPASVTTNPALANEFQQPKGFKESCLPCHDENLMMQQRLTRVQWDAEVGKMVRWGAKVDPANRGALLDYLLKLYGPRPRK